MRIKSWKTVCLRMCLGTTKDTCQTSSSSRLKRKSAPAIYQWSQLAHHTLWLVMSRIQWLEAIFRIVQPIYQKSSSIRYHQRCEHQKTKRVPGWSWRHESSRIWFTATSVSSRRISVTLSLRQLWRSWLTKVGKSLKASWSPRFTKQEIWRLCL